MSIQIHLGDCERGLKTLKDESIDCIITSPPYKNCDGYTPELMHEVFTECFRVLTQTGLCFVNFGHLVEQKSRPFRLALILEKIGFTLQETFIWVKNHFKPIQGERRVNNLTEFIFMFSKNKMPQLDRLAVGIPYKDKSNIGRYSDEDLRCGGNVIITDRDHGNRKYGLEKDYLNKIDTPDKAYLLGFLWADGYLKRGNQQGNIRSFGIELSSRDTQHLVHIRDLLGSTHPIRIRSRHIFGKMHDTAILNINSVDMVTDLLAVGFDNREIPAIPEHLEPAFILGLYDGDGCLSISNHGPVLTFLGKEQLLVWVQNVIIRHTNTKWRAQVKDRDGINSLALSGNQVPLLIEWLYTSGSSLYLERKANKVSAILSNGNYWWIPYETITSSDQKLHNDRFPLGLPTRCLKLAKLPNMVLDPFSGSGTTALACKQLGCNFVGWEIDRMHYDTSLKRLEI